MVRYSMVIDLAKCIGCDTCSLACKVENAVPGRIWWSPVVQKEVGRFPKARLTFLPKLCMHCDDPPCMKACPSKAIYKRDDGIVLVDEQKCCGSRACVTACPYEAVHVWDPAEPTFYADGPTPLDMLCHEKHRVGAAQKCTFCSHRIDLAGGNGLKPGIDREVTPACVVACPSECRIFGDSDDPESPPVKYLSEAEQKKRRIFVLRPEAKTRPSVAYVW